MISFKNKSTRGQSENRQSVGERTRTPKFPSYQARNGSQQRHLFMTSLLLQEALLSSQTNSTVIHLSCNSAGAYQMAEMTAFREFLCKQMKVPLPLRLQLLHHTLFFLSNLVFLNSNLQFLKTFLQLPNFSPSVFALFKRLNIWRNNIFVLIWFFFWHGSDSESLDFENLLITEWRSDPDVLCWKYWTNAQFCILFIFFSYLTLKQSQCLWNSQKN